MAVFLHTSDSFCSHQTDLIFFLSTYKHKVEKIVQLGYNATSAHVICIFLSFPFSSSSSFSKTSDVAGRQYDVEAAF